MSQKRIKLSIDGKTVEATPGQTILETARAHGIEIPTLCHDPRLPPYGSCLVCVVEVEGMKKPAMSCTTAAAEDMKVITQSEALSAARKDALDMLLSNHYADCRGPCYEKCPADVDVQGYLALAHEGQDKAALELIRETNPLPLVCGRVCVRYCEGACARNDVDNSVAINFIKRYVSDLEHDNLDPPEVAPKNGKRVAIVGGGPAGLTCAYYLAKKGVGVTIFEAHPKLGGMLRYGIPDYRLDQQVLDKEIQYIIDHGVEVKTSTSLGKDFTLDQLQDDGFAAIFLGLGAQKAKSMRVDNEDSPGVEGGIEFLDRVHKEGPPALTGHVVVVGGGNTAIDCSRTALRCGADKVSILYRRTRKEMPADEVEIEDAIEEGVDVQYLIAPTRVLTDDAGKARAIACQRMELGEPDKSGRRRPVPVEGSDFEVECSLIIAAIGQDTEIDAIRGSKLGEIKETRWATIIADEHSFATNIPGVFAGGDVVTGPEAAIDAIAHGHKAAGAILQYFDIGEVPKLKGEFLSRRESVAPVPESYWDRFAKADRATMRYKPVAERIKTFEEAEIGIAPTAVGPETARCMSCGCSDVFTCELKDYSTAYGAEQGRLFGKANRYEADLSHPYIALDPNKCIVCSRCVRTCDDLQGIAALGFINRGFDMIVKPALGNALLDTSCISCGNCIDACPTGAITWNSPLERPGPWRTTPSPSVCNYCSVGCGIVYERKNDTIWHVAAEKPDAYTPGEVCMRGRFGHRLLLEDARLREAAIGRNDHAKTATLEEALSAAREGLQKVAQTHGSESLGFFISPKASNEEIFLVSQLARDTFGTNNIGSVTDLQRGPTTLETIFGANVSTVGREELEAADVVVLVNGELHKTSPVTAFAAHRAARRGADLVVLGSSDLADRASLSLPLAAGSTTQLLSGLASELLRQERMDRAFIADRTEGFEAFKAAMTLSVEETATATGLPASDIHALVSLLSDGDRSVVFVYDPDAVDSCAGDLSAIAALLLLTGRVGRAGRGGLMLTHHHANHQGLIDLGANPEAGKGTPGAKTREELLQKLAQGELKGLFLLGEDLADDPTYGKALEQAEFCVAMDAFTTATTTGADVAIPGSLYAEGDGSVTAADRRVRSFGRVFPPPAGVDSRAILAKLCGADDTLASLRQGIVNAQPRYGELKALETGGSFVWNESEGGSLLYGDRFLTDSGKARFVIPAQPTPAGKREATSHSNLDQRFAMLETRMIARN